MENSSDSITLGQPETVQPQPLQNTERYEKPVVRRIGNIRAVTKGGSGLVDDGAGGSQA